VGAVKRQAIIGTFYTFSGAIIGFITTGILFPSYLTTEQIGLISVLVAYAIIFSQFASLGFNNTATRMFSYFRNKEKKHNGFLFIATVVSLAGLLISVLFLILLQPYIIANKADESPLLAEFFLFIIPLIFANLVFRTLDTYYKVLYNAVIGTFSKEIIQRIVILIAIILYFLEILSFSQFLILYVIAFFFPLVLLFISLGVKKELSFKPDFSLFNRDMVNTLISVSFFGIISSATGIITLNIDRIMIGEILGLGPTGIYTTVFFYGTLVILPSRALLKISSVFIADAWKDNDRNKLLELYKQSSINLLLIGILILVGLWVNIDNIFQILDDNYLPGRYVILIIGFAYLFDMSLGVNISIIANSKKYKYNALFKVLLVILIIGFNLILIPKYGIVGAAIASAAAKFLENLIRYIFVQLTFEMQPFNIKSIMVILIGGVAYISGYYLPLDIHFIWDIFIRSGIVIIIYLSMNLIFQTSKDANDIFRYLIRLLKIN